MNDGGNRKSCIVVMEADEVVWLLGFSNGRMARKKNG